MNETVESRQLILALRAQALAKPRGYADRRATIEVMLFRLQDELYAIELPLLRGVQPASGLTLVPCVPPHVAGVLNVRGEIIVVLDLGTILGQPLPPSLDARQVLLVDAPEGRVGLMVDEVVGVREVVGDEIDRSFAGQGFSFGVADARFTFLDLTKFLTDRQLVVDDE